MGMKMSETLDSDDMVDTVDRMSLYELDNGRGAIKFEGTKTAEPVVQEFDDYDTARLAYGLRLTANSYRPCERDDCVPLAVAKAGKDAIAAYLLTRDPENRPSQKHVAGELEVSEQTVRNYAHRVRWSPE